MQAISREPLTERQQQVLDFIRRRREKSSSPTLREIAAKIGVSLHTAQVHVGALIAKGYLERTPNEARSLLPSDPP